MKRDADYRRLIHCRKWRELRKHVLSEHPCCKRCAEEGYVTAANEVHHKTPVETGLNLREKEQLMYDPSNLVALCHACHVRTHVEMTRSGKAQNKARNSEKARAFNARYFGEN